ncbi:MAG: tRNA1(Val) (adenine(37)-N6)-methyltransferase [Lachnospiraceae bacterium]|nr:tRNA1(Val) (adenine(37)-N6)-methyltransferase [Lachnospiraceae bacterium]
MTERIDDLQRDGLRVVQDTEGFLFGIDAVLLSAYARAEEGEALLDLCTGTGVIPILLSAKTKAEKITGLEIWPESVELARKSVRLNGLTSRIEIIEGDVKEADRIFAPASFDVITCNPPYLKKEGGKTSAKDARAVARHEILCTFDDVARAAGTLLKPGGSFYLVHRPFRLPELFASLCKYRLEPKAMRLVHPYADHAPTMVLLRCVRDGRAELQIGAPLIVYEREGVYTKEVLEMYE